MNELDSFIFHQRAKKRTFLLVFGGACVQR